MSEDGINYLDMGDAYLRGDWGMAVNSVWSPMYSWVLGLAMSLVNPPMEWEFPLVHAVNFLIFLGTLASFEFFWLRLARSRYSAAAERGVVGLPEWAWVSIGYGLFFWASLSLTKIWAVTPDMLMAAFAYLAAGLIVRIRGNPASWRLFALLGVALGLGYLAKAIMFPLAPFFLVAAVLAGGKLGITLPRALVAAVLFLAIAGPFIAMISSAKGSLTFGDAGKITYARYLYGLPYPHWQGEGPGGANPLHPSRMVLDAPPIYEFATPVGGTYPISYDPYYWYEGAPIQLDLGRQARTLLTSGLYYFDLFSRQQAALLIGVLVLYGMGLRALPRLTEMALPLGIILPSVAAFGMYALVYVEGRYLSPFLLLLWGGLLAGVRLPDHQEVRRLMSGVSAIILVFLLASLADFHLQGVKALELRENQTQASDEQAPPPEWPGQVAQELHRLGVQPGDRVGVIGYGFNSFWARLARVQIVAEMLESDATPFWIGDATVRGRAIQAFASTGARAVVAENVPGYAPVDGWNQVDDTNYYIRLLEP